MARRLRVSTVVPVPYGVDAGGEAFKVLVAGEKVPDWAVDLLGDHCFEEAEAEEVPKEPTPGPDPNAVLDGGGETGGGGEVPEEPNPGPDPNATIGGDDPAPSGPPPKNGRGSGLPAWAAYAKAKDVEVGEDAKREDVIAALEAAGVPTEPADDGK